MFWTEVRAHPIRSLKTLCLLLTYGTLGLAAGIMGPVLLDLRQQVAADLATIAYVLTARSGGHAIATIASKS